MKKILLLVLVNVVIVAAWGQAATSDSIIRGTVVITKDPRIDMLGKKMTEYNESLANKIHLASGYRLTILSTTDRTQAIQIRTKLLQQYPDQSIYMTFQSPYIRLKFGNFLEKSEAESMRKELLSSGIVPGNIYIVPERVEVKPDKTKQNAED